MENAEEIVEIVEETAEVAKNNPALIVGAGVLGLAVGAAGGYQFAKKRLNLKYQEIADQEIAEAKEFYAKASKAEEFSTPQQAAEALGVDPVLKEAARALISYQGLSSSEPAAAEEEVVEVEVQSHNVFSQEEIDFNYDAEIKQRSPETPYVITFEEFHENLPDHEQTTLTYYEGDDVLAEQDDQVIENVDATVGDENLTRFGHGSKDNNVVYIRNERTGLDFEVLRSGGKYAMEVHGFDEDETSGPNVRKFRRSDDG